LIMEEEEEEEVERSRKASTITQEIFRPPPSGE